MKQVPFGNNNKRGKDKAKQKRSRSRFPSGMTTREARAEERGAREAREARAEARAAKADVGQKEIGMRRTWPAPAGAAPRFET